MAISPRGSTTFVPVTCRCGKALRAKMDQVGTEIRCWACRQPVLVPMPRERLRVAREFAEGFAGATRGAALTRVVAVSAAVTAGFCIPTAGLAAGVVLLMVAATGYGDEIGRAAAIEEPPAEGRAPGRRRLAASAVRRALGSALAAGVVLPIWTWHAGEGHPPHLDRLGLAILAASLVILPLANQAVNGQGRRGPVGRLGPLRPILRFPFATLAALAVVPGCLVMLELGMASLFYIQGTFPFFTLEFMPWKEEPVLYMGVAYFHSIDFRSYPESGYLPAYFSGLARGYSFVGAFPPSLSIGSRAGLGGVALYLPDSAYWAARAFVTAVILVVFLTACSVQARWLGAIAAFEKRRPATDRRQAEAEAGQAQLPGPAGSERNA